MAKTPQELYAEREKRYNDAVALRKPDRVPVVGFVDFFPTRYKGMTNKQAMYDYEATAKAYLDVTLEFDWDMAPSNLPIAPGGAMELLGYKQMHWPGHDLPDDVPFQFVEGEYMKGEEYDEFLANPELFTLRKMLPRLSTLFEPLAELPPLWLLASGYSLSSLVPALAASPGMAKLIETLPKLAQEGMRANIASGKLVQELAAHGYPTVLGSIAMVTYDTISDMFRGMRGTMTDMYRYPDKLLAMEEFFLPSAIGGAIQQTQMTHNPRCFIPLHRGAGTFMSRKQFEKFYWPQLKALLLALIQAGIQPMPFFEGDYTERLDYLAELPPGKIAGWFDVVDVKKAKQVIGKNLCFMGNVPAQLLIAGTPQEVKDYVHMLIDTFGDTGGLIINGAVSGFPAESNPKCVRAVTEAAHEYGVFH
jgi:hypothetical protein